MKKTRSVQCKPERYIEFDRIYVCSGSDFIPCVAVQFPLLLLLLLLVDYFFHYTYMPLTHTYRIIHEIPYKWHMRAHTKQRQSSRGSFVYTKTTATQNKEHRGLFFENHQNHMKMLSNIGKSENSYSVYSVCFGTFQLLSPWSLELVSAFSIIRYTLSPCMMMFVCTKIFPLCQSASCVQSLIGILCICIRMSNGTNNSSGKTVLLAFSVSIKISGEINTASKN